MSTDYKKEREFFDRIARRSTPSRMPPEVFERYASPQWPHLFAKEMMFNLAGNLRGKHVLEVGCGEGISSVQLAYCGAVVDAIDLSPVSIDVARRRAELNGQIVNFMIGNFIKNDLVDSDTYDVVWCDSILHHLTDSLDAVIDTIHRCLKAGGLFIAKEPIAYARWLKTIRSCVPVHVVATDDEQPLRQPDFQIIEQRFSNLQKKYYRILARADRLGVGLFLLRFLARLDNVILMLPGASALAGNAIFWAQKRGEIGSDRFSEPN